MADFAGWLRVLKNPDDAGLKELQDFSDILGKLWPFHSNEVGEYVVIVLSNAPEARRPILLTALARYYAQWKSAEGPDISFWSQITTSVFSNMGSIMLSAFGILMAVIIVYGINQSGFLVSLAQPSQARGFITFLFAISTIALFMLVGVTTFWMEKDEVEVRFSKAKDLLTLIIGIFGTILGFYFGTANNDANMLSLANVPPNFSAVSGGTTTISATVLGGVAPVTYDLTLSDPTGIVNTDRMQVKDKLVVGGTIAQSVAIPADMTSTTALNFSVIVHDAKGNRAQSAGTLVIQPKSK